LECGSVVLPFSDGVRGISGDRKPAAQAVLLVVVIDQAVLAVVNFEALRGERHDLPGAPSRVA
jgi:hypothetical protein